MICKHLDKCKVRVHETTKQTGTPNKHKRLIDKKKRMPFFLYTPPPPSLSLSLPLTLCCSDEYYPSKPELWRNLLFLAALLCLLIFPFLSTPCVFTAPQSLFVLSLSLSVQFFSTLSSFPLHMWISFSLIIMILGSALLAGH